MQKFLAAAAIIIATALVSSPVYAAQKPITLTVMRKGDNIGTHIISFETKGDTTTATIKTRIAVKVLFVTAYKFTCDATETWKDGKLVALESKSNDNGEKHDVKVAQKDGKLAVTADGKPLNIAANAIPSSWWNMDLVKRTQLLDYLTGKMQQISVKKIGNEQISVAGGKENATHYKITGGLERDVWYAKDGTMVRQSLVKKGDLIEYVVK